SHGVRAVPDRDGGRVLALAEVYRPVTPPSRQQRLPVTNGRGTRPAVCDNKTHLQGCSLARTARSWTSVKAVLNNPEVTDVGWPQALTRPLPPLWSLPSRAPRPARSPFPRSPWVQVATTRL